MKDLASAIGLRVSIRLGRESATPETFDLVGILQSPTHIRTRVGVQEFNPQKVLAWRVVREPAGGGSGQPYSMQIQEIEKASNSTWAAPKQQERDGWLARAAGGFSHRANSFLPTGAPPLGCTSLESALEFVAEFFAAHHLPVIGQIPLPLFATLADELASRSWQEIARVEVMTIRNLSTIAPDQGLVANPIIIESTPSPAWLACYGRKLGTQGRTVLASGDARFLHIKDQNEVIGTARVAFANGWAGLSAIKVTEGFRRQGIAQALIEGAFGLATSAGINQLFLQVGSENRPAIRIYERAGFRIHHSYSYLSPR